jgi:myosin-3
VGDIILAVNPFEDLPIYKPAVQNMYLSGSRDGKPPHLYHLAFDGYEALLRTKNSQSFVISGESGAGKSESTKHIINHVMQLCKAGKKTLESQIMSMNPLLEAFGNAKTVMNNNSSRFGKYIEIKFDGTGAVVGAEISEYLLEKSRVCSQQEGEQTYHIFYYLLAGIGQCDIFSYDLGLPSSHNYMNSKGAPTDGQIMSEENVTNFNELLATLTDMGFPEDDIASMLTILCAIMLVGDLSFKENGNDEAEYTSDPKLIEQIANLLQCDAGKLEAAFLSFTSKVGKDTMTRPYNLAKANDNRDAFAKAFYARMFGWIVTHCNATLIDANQPKGEQLLSLGILDIFGFEDFKHNSLEQLCINITNERLHTFFNDYIFTAEIAEYKAEGVEGEAIEYSNNEPTLEMLLKRPGGLLAILDEESKFPKASDATFTQKAAALKSHPSNSMIPAKSDRDLNFTVVHYAGAVKYDTTNFLEKDRDTLAQDFGDLLKFSADGLIQEFWAAKRTGTGTFKIQKGMSMKKAKPAGKAAKKVENTVCAHFATSLNDLLVKISASKPHFVRCLKPNAEKKPAKFDDEQMLRQLRYAGVLETVKIRKVGFAIREPFVEFVKRYRAMAFKSTDKVPNTAATCEKILTDNNIAGFKLGTNKVFLKYYHVEQLTAVRKKHTDALVFIEKVCRGFICRVRYRTIKANLAKQTAAIASMITFA